MNKAINSELDVKHLNDLYEQALKDLEAHQFAVDKIKTIISELEKQDICVFPDFTLQQNMKAVMKQCNSGYVEILKIINEL